LNRNYFLVFLFQTSAMMFRQSEAEKLREVLAPYFVPVKKDTVFTLEEKKKINLGRTLFYDKRLSKNSSVSCNACHDLKKIRHQWIFLYRE